MIAHNRRASDSVAKKKRDKNETHIHQRAVGGNAVFARDFYELQIVQNAHERERDIRDEFRRAVRAGFEERTERKNRLSETERAFVREEEVDERDSAADELGNAGRQSSAQKPPLEHDDKKRVERHIRHARRHGENKPHGRLFRHNQKTLESVLKHKDGADRNHHAPVKNRVRFKLPARAQKPHDCVHAEKNAERNHHAQNHASVHEKRENPVRPPALSLAQKHSDQRTSARSNHKADRRAHHQHGHDKVHRRKTRLPHEVRHKNPVHHAVDLGKNHHYD